MLHLLQCIGKTCQKGHEIQLLKSNSGYYIGTTAEGEPYCRLSAYGSTPDDPIMDTERECVENQFCNGNSIGGCGGKYLRK